MNYIILQNTYCACIDLSSQLRNLIPEAGIACMTEEAQVVVDWLRMREGDADCIIADTEACDGDTIDIFQSAKVHQPLVFTCSSPDEATRCRGLNVIGMILKPVSQRSLRQALSGLLLQT